MGGSKALLERPRNLASPLDKLNLVDFRLILRHHLQSLQYDPKPPRSKRVRCLHLNTLQFWPIYIEPNKFSLSFSKGTLPRLCRSSETGVEGGSSGYITSSNSSNRWRMEMYNTLNVWRGTILSRGWQYPTIHWNYTVSQKQINMGFAGWVEPVFANLETSSLKMPNQLISRLPNSRNSPAMPGGKEDSVVRFV